MKTSSIFALVCAILVMSSMSFCMVSPVSAANGVTTQLCLVIDGSGSISAGDWTLIKQGVADAVRYNMTHDGTVELMVIQFASYAPGGAQVEVPPTVIDGTNYEAVATTIEGITQVFELTTMADGLYLAWQTMISSSNFSIATRHIINLATDGLPNVRNYNATHDWDSSGGIDYYDDVIDVVMNMTGLTELDIEGIGAISPNWYRDWVVRPQPGIIAPPFSKPGWIRVVENATVFQLALAEKIVMITVGTPELTISKIGPLEAYPDQTFSYTINVTNIGDVDAVNVIVNDTLPAGVSYVSSAPPGTYIPPIVTWNLGTIAPNGSVIVNISVTVDSGVLNGTVLTNLAEVWCHDDPGIPYGPANATWNTTVINEPNPVGGYVLEGPFAASFWLPVALAIVLALATTVMVQRNRYKLRL